MYQETHVASGRHVHKPILFPDVLDFRELFPVCISFAKDGNNIPASVEIPGIGPCGPYCNGREIGGSFYVQCSERVADKLGETLVIPTDSRQPLYFDLVDTGKGWVLVMVKYNQILGSRYIAMVRKDTVRV